ncbi:hypothetical protein [Lysobacter arvi]|nr:hypothetical protein [Lysobacter arvi]
MRRIELLDTPRAWEGMPATPTVLASRTVSTPTATAVALSAPVRLDAAPHCSGLATVVVPAPSPAPCD